MVKSSDIGIAVADTTKVDAQATTGKRVRLTREQAAAYLGMTLAGFQWVEKEHAPPRHLDRMKCIYYYQDDLDSLKPREYKHRGRPPKKVSLPREQSPKVGKLAAKIFRMFKAKVDHRTIVIECEVSPKYVEQLWRYWVTPPQSAMKLRAEYDEERRYRYEDNHEKKVEIERIRAQATIDAAREAAKESRARAYEKSKP